MDILKQELFILVLRNLEIKDCLDYLEEYSYNLKCIEIIKQMAGHAILENWRKEFMERSLSYT